MTDPLRIYVASLADYNAGRLHGVHIELTDGITAEEIQEKVNAMLAKSREPIAEEWAIHDYEGFGEYRLSEWSDFRSIAVIGQVAEELNDDTEVEAFMAWINSFNIELADYWDDPNGLEELFRQQYRGRYDSFKDFVLQDDYAEMYLGLDQFAHMAKEADRRSYTGRRDGYQQMYERLTAYIDWDMVARDLEVDFTTAKATPYGIHVFEDNA